MSAEREAFALWSVHAGFAYRDADGAVRWDHLDMAANQWIGWKARAAIPPAANPMPSPAVAPAAGYAMLPLHPTPEMSAAGFCVEEAEHDPAGVYLAMVAAAPRRSVTAGELQRMDAVVSDANPLAYDPQDWTEPHPPSRHCMCPACIPSFDDRFAPPVALQSAAAAVCQHWWHGDAGSNTVKLDELIGNLDAALRAATP